VNVLRKPKTQMCCKNVVANLVSSFTAGFDMTEEEMFGMFDDMFGDLMSAFGDKVASGEMTDEDLMERVMLGGMQKMMNGVMGVNEDENICDMDKEAVMRNMSDLGILDGMGGMGDMPGSAEMSEMDMLKMMSGMGGMGGVDDMTNMMKFMEMKGDLFYDDDDDDDDDYDDEDDDDYDFGDDGMPLPSDFSPEMLSMMHALAEGSGPTNGDSLINGLRMDDIMDMFGGGGGGGLPKPPKKQPSDSTAQTTTQNRKNNNNKKKKSRKKKKEMKGGGAGTSMFVNKAAPQPPTMSSTQTSSTQPKAPKPSNFKPPYSSLSEIEPNSDCIVRGSLTGKVAFLGQVHYAKGDWVGVVLDEPKGKNGGTVKGKQYFSCADNHGLLVRPSEVAPQ